MSKFKVLNRATYLDHTATKTTILCIFEGILFFILRDYFFFFAMDSACDNVPNEPQRTSPFSFIFSYCIQNTSLLEYDCDS